MLKVIFFFVLFLNIAGANEHAPAILMQTNHFVLRSDIALPPYLIQQTFQESSRVTIEGRISFFQNFLDLPSINPIQIILEEAREQNDAKIYGHFSPEEFGADTIFISASDFVRAPERNFISTMTHELFHLFHYKFDQDEEFLINEGVALLFEQIVEQRTHINLIHTFLDRSDNLSLQEMNRDKKYAYSYLLMSYLYHHLGDDFLKDLIKDQDNGYDSLKKLIMAKNLSFESLLRDFTLALLFNNQIYSSRFDFSHSHRMRLDLQDFIPSSRLPRQGLWAFRLEQQRRRELAVTRGRQVSTVVCLKEDRSVDIVAVRATNTIPTNHDCQHRVLVLLKY